MSEVIAPQDAKAAWKEVADERAGKEPKPAKAVETPPVVKSAEPAAVVTEPTEPEWKKEFTELKSQLDSRLRKSEGHIGQIIGSQKEIKELLAASQQAKQQVGSDAPTQAEVKQAAADPSEWADLKRQYPEWALATEKFFEARQPEAFDAKAFEATLREEMKGQTEAVRKEIISSALDVVLPDWENEIKTDGFVKWLEKQQEDVKALANSDRVGDAARMLKLYDASKQSNPTNVITEQRKATLAAATAAPRGAPTRAVTKSVDDMTPAELWAHERKQREKRNGAR